MSSRASIFDDTPGAVRRLVLLVYTVASVPFAALLWLEALPGRGLPAAAALLGVAALEVGWLLHRRAPGTGDWLLAVSVGPAVLCGIGSWATGSDDVAILVLSAALPWSAALFARPVFLGATIVNAATVLAVSAEAHGWHVGAIHATAFATLGLLLGGILRGRARRAREARLRVLEKHLNDIELVVRPDGAIVGANDRAAEAYGYSGAELLAMNVGQLRAGGERSSVAGSFAAVAQAGTVFEADHVRRDGSILPVEVSARPFRVDGKPYLHCLVRDIGARRRAEEQRRFLSTLVTRMQEGVVTLDGDGIVRTWSAGAERIFGFTAEEAVGRSPFSFLIPEDLVEETRRVHAETMARGELRLTARRRHRSGRELVAAIATVTLHDHAGRPNGFLAVYRDVTEEEAMQASLRESERRLATALAEVRAQVEHRERLMAVVAHDLRSPLAAIRSAAHGLERPIEDAELRADYAERGELIASAAASMNRLIDDLVDVAAIQTGALRLRPIEVQPLELIAEATQLARPIAERAGLTLVTPGAAEAPALCCDRGRVLQVLGNLIVNAVHATPAGGRITVRLEDAGAEVAFSVQDTGRGLPADTTRLFEPYQRGPDARHRGAGVGLAIARGIVEGHGGTIRAERADGGGARFRFTIPRRGEGMPPCAA